MTKEWLYCVVALGYFWTGLLFFVVFDERGIWVACMVAGWIVFWGGQTQRWP